MKKTFYILLAATLFISSNLSAQEIQDTISHQRYFALGLSFDLGSGNLNNAEFYDLNGHTNGAELSVSYILEGFYQNLILSSGISQTDFTTNIDLPGQLSTNSSLKASYIQIPLMLAYAYKFKDGSGKRNFPIRPILGIGVNSNYHLQTEIKNKAFKNKDKALGWTFNFMAKLGFDFDLSEHLMGSITYNVDSPFKKSVNNSEKTFLYENNIKLGVIYKF